MTILYDNTRLKDFRNCPRYYYLRHLRDWAGAGTRDALVFGSAWHAAMDAVWEYIPQDDDQTVVAKAYFAFEQKWVEEGYPGADALDDERLRRLGNRTPFNAMEMLHAYVERRRSFIEGIELLDIEKPFAVPLDPDNPNLFYVGRLDKVFRWQGRVYVGEHKTTSLYKRDGGFRSAFIDSFSPNSQIDGYIHAVHMLYGEEAKGVMVDAALVHKDQRHFAWIPVDRDISQLEAWLWETHDTMEDIEKNLQRLNEHEATQRRASAMPAFRKNTESCFQFGSMCQYLDICKSHSDPHKISEPPLGFHEEHWSPFDFHNLASIGLTEEER